MNADPARQLHPDDKLIVIASTDLHANRLSQVSDLATTQPSSDCSCMLTLQAERPAKWFNDGGDSRVSDSLIKDLSWQQTVDPHCPFCTNNTRAQITFSVCGPTNEVQTPPPSCRSGRSSRFSDDAVRANSSATAGAATATVTSDFPEVNMNSENMVSFHDVLPHCNRFTEHTPIHLFVTLCSLFLRPRYWRCSQHYLQ